MRKHRWSGAGSVVAVRRRHRTTFEIFRSLGRPQDAERFFRFVFSPFPPYIVGIISSASCLSSVSLCLASPAATGNTGSIGLGDEVTLTAPGLTPTTCPCFPSCGEVGGGAAG